MAQEEHSRDWLLYRHQRLAAEGQYCWKVLKECLNTGVIDFNRKLVEAGQPALLTYEPHEAILFLKTSPFPQRQVEIVIDVNKQAFVMRTILTGDATSAPEESPLECIDFTLDAKDCFALNFRNEAIGCYALAHKIMKMLTLGRA